MPYSAVEVAAFRYRDPGDDPGDCERRTNGLWSDDETHCRQCRNAIRVSKPRPYQVYDYLGRCITSDCIEVYRYG